MSNAQITPVILAGGTGTRLWPLSRTELPKQFCKLLGEESLFQSTLRRVAEISAFGSPIVVTSARYRDLVLIQAAAAGVDLRTVICESVGRNTAPAIALATLAGNDVDENEMLCVLPSDHAVSDRAAFEDALGMAAQICLSTDDIVVLGIEPSGPETGYGYIEVGEPLATNGYRVGRFIEKPEQSLAEAMVVEGGHVWNAGIFLARRRCFAEELHRHAPDLMKTVAGAVTQGFWAGAVFHPAAKAYAAVETISFDYAVMERTQRASVVTANPKWSDLGSYAAIHQQGERCSNNNVLAGDILVQNSSGCLALSEDKLVALVGVQDMVVVSTDDAVLVTPRKAAQNVKEVVARLKQLGRREADSHTGEDRPWGRFDSLDRSENHQVKRIRVEPGGQLSLQYHHHRAEHWIVVSGTACVTLDHVTRDLSCGQHLHIPKGAVHRLENRTEAPVELIEVQLGSYLGEDDIVRLDDVYGRDDPGKPVRVA